MLTQQLLAFVLGPVRSLVDLMLPGDRPQQSSILAVGMQWGPAATLTAVAAEVTLIVQTLILSKKLLGILMSLELLLSFWRFDGLPILLSGRRTFLHHNYGD